MNKLNRLVRNSDLKWISEVRDENNWIEKYPHSTCLGNHWVRDEALYKWVFALLNFGIGTSGKKVIDLGVQNGCVPHVVADWGNDTIALDIKEAPWEQPKSSAKLVIANAFEWLLELEDESIDVFFIITSDVGDAAAGSYIKAESFIEIVERAGFKITSEFDGTIDGDTFYNADLKVASMDFVK